MTKPIIIAGAGRQGRNAADVLEARKAIVAGYLDDSKQKGEIVAFNYRVLDGFAAMRDQALVLEHSWLVAIGDNHTRSKLYNALANSGATFVSAVHTSAQILSALVKH